jgi:hypothetical protein
MAIGAEANCLQRRLLAVPAGGVAGEADGVAVEEEEVIPVIKVSGDAFGDDDDALANGGFTQE